MKIAAGILGLLVGMFSLSYVGLFGGMLGGAAGWFASMGPSGNDMSQWADTVKTLSWLAPSLVLVGGGITFVNPLVGGGCMALGSYGLWYLMGFGSIGNDFIIPSGAAAALALVAGVQGFEGTDAEPGPGEFLALSAPTLQTVSCTSCDYRNAPGARFCNACGVSLAPAAAQAPAPAVMEHPPLQRCSWCASFNANDSRFCEECGNVLAAA